VPCSCPVSVSVHGGRGTAGDCGEDGVHFPAAEVQAIDLDELALDGRDGQTQVLPQQGPQAHQPHTDPMLIQRPLQ
jgi:hypothetical protein